MSEGNYLCFLAALITSCVNIPANKQLFNIDQNDGEYQSFLLCDRLWAINLVTSQKLSSTWWINSLPTKQLIGSNDVHLFADPSWRLSSHAFVLDAIKMGLSFKLLFFTQQCILWITASSGYLIGSGSRNKRPYQIFTSLCAFVVVQGLCAACWKNINSTTCHLFSLVSYASKQNMAESDMTYWHQD